MSCDSMSVLRSVPLGGIGDLIQKLDKVIDRNGSSSSLLGGAPNGQMRISIHDLSAPANLSQSEAIKELGSEHSTTELVSLLTAYSIVFVLSLIGNLLVFYVVWRSKRLHTVTHIFILNLSLSDIFITIFNIPFNMARNLMASWVFGQFMCAFINFLLMTSVYVSTFTMMAIAIDRYIVIIHPLRPRLTLRSGGVVCLVTWIVGGMLSLPFALFSADVPVEMFFTTVLRCRICYPEPADVYERFITMGTFTAQYVLPLLLTAVMYGQIVRCVWLRKVIGQTTHRQRIAYEKKRRRTIKMLMIVVVVFSFCWLPINLYHLLTDFHPNSQLFSYNSTAYLTCHWLAMSSVCYNPLIYCWLHERFRQQLHHKFSCFFRTPGGTTSLQVHPGTARDHNGHRPGSHTPKTPGSASNAKSLHGSSSQPRRQPRSSSSSSSTDRANMNRFCNVPLPTTNLRGEVQSEIYCLLKDKHPTLKDTLVTSSSSSPNLFKNETAKQGSFKGSSRHSSHWV